MLHKNNKGTILIVDDERAIRNSLSDILGFEGYEVVLAEDGRQAMDLISSDTHFDCILCDIKMPFFDGMEVLEKSVANNPEVPIIIISGHGDVEMAVDAVKRGAFDFIVKPPDLNRLLITIRNATDKKKLVSETKSLKKKISKKAEIIGVSQPIKDVLELASKVAPTDARILIMGSNGTGKELIAHRIHELSHRSKSPIIEVNCAAIPSELIESELFGHEKGAFTSAVKQRIGKFELADGGTLFLDEIGDMGLSAQAKVLRALQEGKIVRVGGEKEIAVNTRIIAATNKNLQVEIDAGRFREDLYHRLSVILIQTPTLNERTEDIPVLAEHFIGIICTEYKMSPKTISNAAIEALQTHTWTGNVREFRNAMERLIILGGDVITEENVKRYILK